MNRRQERTLSRNSPTAREALSDELLAVRCQLGEAAAFDALVERWHAPLWGYVRRLVEDDDDAAETLQDVWLRVLRALPGLRDPARLRPWIFGIARRAIMDRLRRRYGEPAMEAVEVEAIAAPEEEKALTGGVALLQTELAAMPLTEREVLVLFYLEGLSLAQVADVLAVPVGTVKSRLFRARGMLRGRLLERGYDHD